MVSDDGTMDDSGVPDGNAASDGGRKPEIGVNDHIVLKVRFLTDHNPFQLSPKHSTKHDNGTGGDLD